MSLMSAEALTLSLPRCRLKTTNESAKFEILMSFLFVFALACERTYIRTRSIERRFVTEPEKKHTVCRPVCARFSPEIFTGWGGEGLKHSALKRDERGSKTMRQKHRIAAELVRDELPAGRGSDRQQPINYCFVRPETQGVHTVHDSSVSRCLFLGQSLSSNLVTGMQANARRKQCLW